MPQIFPYVILMSTFSLKVSVLFSCCWFALLNHLDFMRPSEFLGQLKLRSDDLSSLAAQSLSIYQPPDLHSCLFCNFVFHWPLPSSVSLPAFVLLLTSNCSLSWPKKHKDLQIDTVCRALCRSGSFLGALRHTFLSTLRSHLGQKELIPVSCNWRDARQ